ncbi:hypothetical protein RM780_15610 [Streptomyces sp. DSM 44917]|uniref:ABC transporter permease n=1 Tax=Streptomyces boetiae TaxID=3075541 RepID=A0ABU2LAK9_9ACTN|nr:hypothetical protein [Streptomyces sp. DSM 44917]MDT0308377.1 hypothetical protein [Streptomyces sp. DSM 44917]
METSSAPLTPDQARAALADAERVRASTAALSATPWPAWFATAIALYLAALPIAYAGFVADRDWLLPRPAWLALTAALIVTFLALFAAAANRWRAATGVALRLDVLPKRATVPLFVALPVLLVGSAYAFRATGSPAWPLAASVLGAAVSLAFHRAFIRLHRRNAS